MKKILVTLMLCIISIVAFGQDYKCYYVVLNNRSSDVVDTIFLFSKNDTLNFNIPCKYQGSANFQEEKNSQGSINSEVYFEELEEKNQSYKKYVYISEKRANITIKCTKLNDWVWTVTIYKPSDDVGLNNCVNDVNHLPLKIVNENHIIIIQTPSSQYDVIGRKIK